MSVDDAYATFGAARMAVASAARICAVLCDGRVVDRQFAYDRRARARARSRRNDDGEIRQLVGAQIYVSQISSAQIRQLGQQISQATRGTRLRGEWIVGWSVRAARIHSR